MRRLRLITALMTTAALAFSAAPATAPAKGKAKRHCVKFKTYKKHGKKYKRCSKYSKK